MPPFAAPFKRVEVVGKGQPTASSSDVLDGNKTRDVESVWGPDVDECKVCSFSHGDDVTCRPCVVSSSSKCTIPLETSDFLPLSATETAAFSPGEVSEPVVALVTSPGKRVTVSGFSDGS